jgi:hypothetical protein
MTGQDTPEWERWLNVGGSLASLAALGYLLTHLPRRGERQSIAGLAGLPKTGRIPLPTAKRALNRLGRKAKACGITPALLREGMEIEREHRDITGGRVLQTAKIAAAHICERRDYYKRIKRFVEK